MSSPTSLSKLISYDMSTNKPLLLRTLASRCDRLCASTLTYTNVDTLIIAILKTYKPLVTNRQGFCELIDMKLIVQMIIHSHSNFFVTWHSVRDDMIIFLHVTVGILMKNKNKNNIYYILVIIIICYAKELLVNKFSMWLWF